MSTVLTSWGIVPYVGDSAFKRARVYDEAQTQAVRATCWPTNASPCWVRL